MMTCDGCLVVVTSETQCCPADCRSRVIVTVIVTAPRTFDHRRILHVLDAQARPVIGGLVLAAGSKSLMNTVFLTRSITVVQRWRSRETRCHGSSRREDNFLR